LNSDALGKLFEGGILKYAAGVGGGLGEDGKGKVVVFGFMAALLERVDVLVVVERTA
jgi:hypothetical protein